METRACSPAVRQYIGKQFTAAIARYMGRVVLASTVGLQSAAQINTAVERRVKGWPSARDKISANVTCAVYAFANNGEHIYNKANQKSRCWAYVFIKVITICNVLCFLRLFQVT